MTEQDTLRLIQASLRKRNAQKKIINILICFAIVFLGVTATIYKVRYILLAFIVVYGIGYLLSWMFSWLNLKLSWIWYSHVARKTGSGKSA